MKRSDALTPLSHDHHAGLAFVGRLKKAEREDADPALWVDEVHAFWIADLVPHFADEEAVVLPVLKAAAPSLAERMVREHRLIRTAVGRVATEPPSWDRALGDIAELVAAHIRFEERDAFPEAERRLSASELLDAGAALAQRHATRADHDA